MKVLRALALVACVVGASARAGAAPEPTPEDVQEAKVRFEAGESAFRAGRFREALGEFQGGYVLTRNPGFLLNIAVCYRKMGEDQQALDGFRDFLKEAPESPRRGEVERQIAELERKLGPAAGPSAAGDLDPARMADGSRDPAAPLPPSKPVAAPAAPQPLPAPRSAPRRTQAAAVDDAEEEDGVALVQSSRRRRSAAPAPTVRDEADAESEGNGRIWLYGGLAVAVLAGVAVAFALSGGDKSASPTLGVVDLR